MPRIAFDQFESAKRQKSPQDSQFPSAFFVPAFLLHKPYSSASSPTPSPHSPTPNHYSPLPSFWSKPCRRRRNPSRPPSGSLASRLLTEPSRRLLQKPLRLENEGTQSEAKKSKTKPSIEFTSLVNKEKREEM